MITLASWVVIVPLAVVDRNLHFRWIAIIHAVRTSIIFATVIVLWVVNVGVVHEAIEIARCAISAPSRTVRLRLLRAGHGNHSRQNSGGKCCCNQFLSEHSDYLHEPRFVLLLTHAASPVDETKVPSLTSAALHSILEAELALTL